MNFFSKENPDRWYHLAWCLCVISLPLPNLVNSACIILLAIVTITDGQLTKKLDRLKTARWAWPFFGYYILVIIGLSYTADIDGGLFTLQKKIAFVVLPLIAILGRQLSQSMISFLKFCFVYSCTIVILLSLITAAIQFSTGVPSANFDAGAAANYSTLHPNASPLWLYFSYIQLSQWADLHPAYFSMYLVFCLVILFTAHYDSRKQIIFHLFIGLLISGFIALLSARMAIIAFTLSAIYLAGTKIMAQKLSMSLPILSSIAAVSLLVWFNPVTHYRLVEEPMQSEYRADSSVTQWNSVTYRLLEWQGSWSVIHANPLLGVGTSGWKIAMNNFYNNFNNSTVGLTYNPHNQFLQTWMENGALALIAFLACVFGSLFRHPIDQSYVAFILIFSLMCLTESVIERQKGIAFFTVFQSLFLAFENKNP